MFTAKLPSNPQPPLIANSINVGIIAFESIVNHSFPQQLQLKRLATEDLPLHAPRPRVQPVFQLHVLIVSLVQPGYLPPHPHPDLLRSHLVLTQHPPQSLQSVSPLLLTTLQRPQHLLLHKIHLGPKQPHLVSLTLQFLLLPAELSLNRIQSTLRYEKGRLMGSRRVNSVPSSFRKPSSKLVKETFIWQPWNVSSVGYLTLACF